MGSRDPSGRILPDWDVQPRFLAFTRSVHTCLSFHIDLLLAPMPVSERVCPNPRCEMDAAGIRTVQPRANGSAIGRWVLTNIGTYDIESDCQVARNCHPRVPYGLSVLGSSAGIPRLLPSSMQECTHDVACVPTLQAGPTEPREKTWKTAPVYHELVARPRPFDTKLINSTCLGRFASLGCLPCLGLLGKIQQLVPCTSRRGGNGD